MSKMELKLQTVDYKLNKDNLSFFKDLRIEINKLKLSLKGC